MSAVGDLDLFNTRYAGGNLAKHVGRRTAKKINRGRGKQGRKKKPEAAQDNTPADVRVVILVLVGFLAALFLVTKLSLGL